MINISILILRKDIKSELAKRFALSTALLFALISVFAVGMGMNYVNVLPQSTERGGLLSVFFWIVMLFASSSGLSHTFNKEEDTGTGDYLRMLAPSSAVFLGKFLFNLILLLCVEIITLPFMIILMDWDIPSYRYLIPVLISGTFGLAAVGTIMASLSARSGAKGALFPILSIPVVLPIFLMSVILTDKSTDPYMWKSFPVVNLLIMSGVILFVFTVSLILFRFIWED